MVSFRGLALDSPVGGNGTLGPANNIALEKCMSQEDIHDIFNDL